MIDLKKWKRKQYKIEDMKPYGDNPREITEEGLQELRESLEEIGYIDDIALFHDGTIASGHARYYICLADGIKSVPVKQNEKKLNKKQKQEIIVRMNKNIAGKWDFNILGKKFDIDDCVEWGFDEGDIGSWDSDIESVNKVKENDDGIRGVIKVSCNQEDKEDLKEFLKKKLMKAEFEEVIIE